MSPSSLPEDHTPSAPTQGGTDPFRAAARAQSLRAEQVELLYTHAPFALAISIVNAFILVAAEHNVMPASALVIWLGYMVSVGALRSWSIRRYRRRAPAPGDTAAWEARFVWGAFLAGLGWGVTGIWLVPPDSLIHQMFVTFLLAGMTAGAVLSLSARRSAFLAFAIPTLLPTIAVLFRHGTAVSVAMGLMCCLFALFALTIAERMYRTIKASVELRYDNQLLITDLTNQVTQRRQAEVALQRAHDDLETRVRLRTEELAQANLALRAEIEERQRMAQALQASVERFNRAVQGAQEGLWEAQWAAPDWFNTRNPVYYSPRFKALLGYTDQELPNLMESWLSRVHPEDRDYLLTAFRRHLENRTAFDVEFRMVTKNEGTRWFAARGQALWDELGAPLHMSGSLRDVTEHKELEEKLLQAQKLEAVGRLAAGVAHDFNNLLTPILGYADVLSAKVPQGSVEARRLGDIRRAALHGANLVRQLLTFGRKQPVTPRILDLNREVEESEELLRRTLGEDIEILFDLTERLSPICLDPTQLQQIILNLAANARDAMPNGGCLTVSTGQALDEGPPAGPTPGRYVRLSVTDTGAGIPPDVLDHVFEPFFTTKEVGKGSGLGLSVVEGIVAQANGRVTVTSRVGVGTTFQILLPEAEGAPYHQNDSGAATPQGRGTLLVVEDNAAVRDFSTQVLTDLGYCVLVAKNGQEALDVAAHYGETIDLLVTDVVMPGISGVELAHRLETGRPQLRVLYVTGHHEERLATRAGNRPLTPLLSKPFTAEELARRVRELLAGHQTPSNT